MCVLPHCQRFPPPPPTFLLGRVCRKSFGLALVFMHMFFYFCSNWFFKCLRNVIFSKERREMASKWPPKWHQNWWKMGVEAIMQNKPQKILNFRVCLCFFEKVDVQKTRKNAYETRFFTSAFRTQDLTKCVQKAKQNLCKIVPKWDPEGFQNRFRKKS